MYLPSFEYLDPKSIPEIFALLQKYGENAKVLAGGTDLLVKMKEKEIRPRYLIDLKTVAGLDFINYVEGSGITLGALTLLDNIERSPLIQEKAMILSLAAASIGVLQTRNKATLGGNICNASPAADMATALLALDAKVKVIGPENEKIIPLERFFLGPGQIAIHPKEILTEVIIPEAMLSQTGVFLKYTSRKALDLAIVNLGIVLKPDTGGTTIQDMRISLGAVAPTPIRLKSVESLFTGNIPTEPLLDQATEKANEEVRPINDMRASADYRREMVKVFIKRGIRQAWEEVKKSGAKIDGP